MSLLGVVRLKATVLSAVFTSPVWLLLIPWRLVIAGLPGAAEVSHPQWVETVWNGGFAPVGIVYLLCWFVCYLQVQPRLVKSCYLKTPFAKVNTGSYREVFVGYVLDGQAFDYAWLDGEPAILFGSRESLLDRESILFSVGRKDLDPRREYFFLTSLRGPFTLEASNDRYDNIVIRAEPLVFRSSLGAKDLWRRPDRDSFAEDAIELANEALSLSFGEMFSLDQNGRLADLYGRTLAVNWDKAFWENLHRLLKNSGLDEVCSFKPQTGRSLSFSFSYQQE